eukprot:761998-Hanusia_phi.AAC.1
METNSEGLCEDFIPSMDTDRGISALFPESLYWPLKEDQIHHLPELLPLHRAPFLTIPSFAPSTISINLIPSSPPLTCPPLSQSLVLLLSDSIRRFAIHHLLSPRSFSGFHESPITQSLMERTDSLHHVFYVASQNNERNM